MKHTKHVFPIALLGALVATTAVWANHPTPGQMGRVTILAHELETAAHRVHVAAERSSHHNTRAEDDALRRLHTLDQRARQFHREVERRYRAPYHTEPEFIRLFQAFNNARHAMTYLHAVHPVRRDFNRVERLMYDLVDYYDGDGLWRRYGGHHRFPAGRYR
jgi:hypothetical protein